jgi:chloramphenicol-sensitive protein RarD
VSTPAPPNTERHGPGIVYAVLAYVLWGFLPAFFLLLSPASAVEIVAWRIVLSLVFCGILIAVTRGWGRFAALVKDRRVLFTMAGAGALILVNWLVYVYAALSGQVVEASLGYFTNPIVTVLLGVFVLRERLRPLQWVAIGISAIAVIVLAIGHGSFPWIALVLAFSFGLYGLIKKRVGGRVDAVGGLTLETLWLAPFASIALVVMAMTTGLTMGTQGVGATIAMLSAGIVTAIPLLLFAAAARRIPLTYLGLAQYLAPTLQFFYGVVLLHEAMPPGRLAGFALVWLALVVLTFDMFRAGRSPRRASLERP